MYLYLNTPLHDDGAMIVQNSKIASALVTCPYQIVLLKFLKV